MNCPKCSSPVFHEPLQMQGDIHRNSIECIECEYYQVAEYHPDGTRRLVDPPAMTDDVCRINGCGRRDVTTRHQRLCGGHYRQFNKLRQVDPRIWNITHFVNHANKESQVKG